MSIKEHGLDRFGRMIARNIDQAHYFGQLVENESTLELLAPIVLDIVCFRFNPGGRLEEAVQLIDLFISKGVIVTHYWHDRDGIGPYAKVGTTYGWGCVYPVDVIRSAMAAVETAAPEEDKDKIAQVRERAEAAFEALDQEIERREPPAEAPMPTAASEAPTPE